MPGKPYVATVTLAAAFSIGLLAQFTAGIRVVVLHASVSDRHGNLVSTLDRDAFRVFENGTPQDIKLFRHQDIPVSLGILIDGSASMLQKLREWRPQRWRWCANRTRRTKYSSSISTIR